MYKIGEFSRLSGISVKALRFYDKEGVLIPDHIDKFTGYRYYSPSQLDEIHKIIVLKELGFNLQEIKVFHQDVMQLLNNKETELNVTLLHINDQLKKLSNLKEMMLMNNLFHIVIQKQSAVNCVSKRKLFKNYQELLDEVYVIRHKMEQEGYQCSEEFYVINYEISLPFEDLSDMEISIPFQNVIHKRTCFEHKRLTQNSEMACLVCNQDTLHTAYSSLQLYIQNNHYQIIGPFYEIYHADGTIELKVPIWKLSDRNELYENDNISIPFVNDAEIIGHWKVIDILPSKECFHPQKHKMPVGIGNFNIKELYFLPGGENYWCFGWTKGNVISTFGYPKKQALNPYELFKVDDKTYMFLELKSDDCFTMNALPEIYVLQQMDHLPHKREDIRICDDLDYPFVTDEKVLGEWNVCDYIENIEDFNPEQPNHHFSKDSLFFRNITFRQGGGCDLLYGDGKHYCEPNYTWTNGRLLAHLSKVSEAYTLYSINGIDYLFIEWKSGDYIYGMRQPYFYVFKRGR
jgi:DNA-binding transcriptional MerR regulator